MISYRIVFRLPSVNRLEAKFFDLEASLPSLFDDKGDLVVQGPDVQVLEALHNLEGSFAVGDLIVYEARMIPDRLLSDPEIVMHKKIMVAMSRISSWRTEYDSELNRIG